MSTPNPLIPQGSLHHKAGRGNSNVRIAVATIVGIHVVFFGGLLLQGCKRDTQLAQNDPEAETNEATLPTYTLPPLTNSSDLYYSSGSTLPGDETNLSATPTTSTVSRTSGGYEPIYPAGGSTQQATAYTSPAPRFGSPEPQREMKDYTVVRGDSFYKIAKDNNTTIKALTEANPNIDPARLQIGAKIKIPVGAPPSTSSGQGTGTRSGGTESNGMTYTVKSGDTLTGIASRHGTTVSALRAANGLRTSRLLVGQKLKIPAKNGSTNASGTGPSI